MIDRALVNDGSPYTGAGLSVVLPPEEQGWVVHLPDGGVEIRYGDAPARVAAEAPFDANLAEFLEEQTLQTMASDLRHAVDEDLTSRREWEDALTKGLDLLGIRQQERTIPWNGACGIVHPMILEAATRFQSKSMTRLFPPKG